MTDNEIVRALEKEIRLTKYVDSDYANVKLEIIESALNLIKRQQTEIERLHTEKDNLIKTFAECQKDVIKEFAEKLKDTKFKQGNDYIIYASNIDILVKEIVGDKK